jgi:hypothetical protein
MTPALAHPALSPIPTLLLPLTHPRMKARLEGG